MAGIGFHLRQMLSRDTFFSSIKAYFFASVISSGPWIFTIICLAILNLIVRPFLERPDALLLRSIFVQMFAVSLILTAPFLMSFTRAF